MKRSNKANLMFPMRKVPRVGTYFSKSNFQLCSYRYSSSKVGYFYEETAHDPLKKKFDERMHRYYGSNDAIKLSVGDQQQLMPEDNMAAVLNKALDVEIYAMEKPSIIQPWEVLLKVDHTGICGSDLEYYKHGVIGPFVLSQPMIMGHESGGTVLAAGKAVNNGLKPGDKIALEPGLVCGECISCRAKKYNLCPEVTFFATPPVHGTMRKYMKHHFNYCYKIPDTMTTEEAAWCEPLSVGIHAGGNVANIQNGASVAIFGAGPIGIINLLTSIGYGAKNILITDINNDKLRMVNDYIGNNPSLGNVNIMTRNTLENPITSDFITDNLMDNALECVGYPAVMADALNITKPGGTVTVIGMAANSNMNVDMSNVNVQEKTVNGVFRYRYTYERAIDMISNGKIGDIKQLITHRANPWNTNELEEALQMLDPKMQSESGRTDMKIMYDMNLKPELCK